MKKTFIAILFVFMTATLALAGTNVSFEWDANTEADLAGYKVYRSTVSGSGYVEKGNIPCPPNDATCCKFTDSDVPDGTYYWVATAYDQSGNESGYSNVVSESLDTVPPGPPGGLNIWQKIIAWIKALFGWLA